MQVRDRVHRAKRAVLRARYAGVFGGIGGAVGGFYGFKAATAGAAVGGLVGALIGELRAAPGERLAAAAAERKEQLEERVPVRG
ncbi:hypothetical protein ACFQDG_05515 [Natronoarchaeum mannanilyticum]|uniref:Glycine zipper 2TM domain-containing protein n=1 Tax=Natronoarchaeum mannanilyticum TaxID=926360 RepID=A0AAV3TBI6_9EURY